MSFHQFNDAESSCQIGVQTPHIKREQEFRAISLPECKLNLERLLDEVRGEEKHMQQKQ